MIRFEAQLMNKDIKKLKTLIASGLEEVVRNFVQQVVREISYNAPVGDAVKNAGLYRLRQKYDNRLKPIEGLSANNWRIALRSGATAISQTYGEPSSEQLGVDAYNKLSSYKLGQTVYIVNNAPHIQQVLEGKYHLPNGTYVNKEPFAPVVLGVVQSSFDIFNKEVGKLQLKLNGV